MARERNARPRWEGPTYTPQQERLFTCRLAKDVEDARSGCHCLAPHRALYKIAQGSLGVEPLEGAHRRDVAVAVGLSLQPLNLIRKPRRNDKDPAREGPST